MASTKQAKQREKQSAIKTKEKTSERWKWDSDKTEKFLEAAVAFKRQMLGEGMEWDSYKVVMREHNRFGMANEYPNDFGKPAVTEPNKDIEDMTKEKYQKYAQAQKAGKESIRLGYSRISNKLKSLTQSYVKDCRDGLRSGAGQLTSQFWHGCHELWGGSAGTEPLEFGLETQGQTLDESQFGTDQDISYNCDENDLDEQDSQSTIGTNMETKKRKSTKHFVDNKREICHKGLTQKARQEILLQHSQKQLDVQEKMLEAINKKDEHLRVAIKSMADSTTMLYSTLATTLQTLTGCRYATFSSCSPITAFTHARVVVPPHYDSNPYGLSEFGSPT